jgi:putative transposase
MPWQEGCKVDERLGFVARLLEGEKMAVLCREFDISRKTGHKIFNRYKESGLEGLTDRSRRPYRQANRLPFQVETLIVQLKKEHPTWGAPKIREKIKRRHSEITLPAISTVHAVLERHNLVARGRKPRYHAQGTTLSRPTRPNELWCAESICGPMPPSNSHQHGCKLHIDAKKATIDAKYASITVLYFVPWLPSAGPRSTPVTSR